MKNTKKKWLLVFAISAGLLSGSLFAQQDKKPEQGTLINSKFYHIDLEINIDEPYIKGSVQFLFAALKPNIDGVELDLSSAFKVSKVEGVASFEQQGELVLIKFEKPLAAGESVTFKVFYEGTPISEQFEGFERGMLFKQHGDEKVIATACYPQHAHLWFPCVQRVIDKVDSVYLDITIADKKTEVEIKNPKTGEMQKQNIPYSVVSNGVLVKTIKGEGKKTYQWKHCYRIAPQHILIAVSNFAKISTDFKGKDYKLPIDFYVLPEKYEEAQAMVNRAPEIMECLTKTFGDYPFRKERFSVTQVGFPLGGMEGMPTQTNVLMESVKSNNISALVRQTAAMWFGNHISPLTVKDLWITEGLASYAEAMWQEYKRGILAVDITLKEKKQYFEAGILTDITDGKNYNSELLYKRGAYVIHMLRGLMTDAYFFDALKGMTSLKKMRGEIYGKTYITTEDFRKICQYYASENEEQDFTYFFDEWVNGEYFPIYTVKFQNGKKGAVSVTLRQEARSTKPSSFIMPATLKFYTNDSTYHTEKIVNDKAEQTFTFNFGKPVLDVTLDPMGWIFKEVNYTHQLINTKTPISNFKISSENNGRTVNIAFASAKKQDVIIELTELDPDGNRMKPQVQTILAATGDIKQSLKIPLDKKSRAVYILKIIGKSDIFTKELYLNRLENLF